MEFIYKLMGIASAVAEEVVPGADAGTLVEGATDAAATGVPTQMTLLESIIFWGGQLLPFIIIFVVMYFFMIRPEKKRKKKEQEMLAALKRGDRICTIGGIYGTIADIKDDTITLTVGRDNLSMVVTRWAIRSVEDVSIENDSEALN